VYGKSEKMTKEVGSAWFTSLYQPIMSSYFVKKLVLLIIKTTYLIEVLNGPNPLVIVLWVRFLIFKALLNTSQHNILKKSSYIPSIQASKAAVDKPTDNW